MPAREPCLFVRIGRQLCALPAAHAGEVMRPLPIDPLPGMPPFVLGVSVIRGTPLPVVDAAAFVGGAGDPPGPPARFVTLRVDRPVALAVQAVAGVRAIDAATRAELPPLLADARRHIVDAIGTLDRELLIVLQSGRRVADEIWARIDREPRA